MVDAKVSAQIQVRRHQSVRPGVRDEYRAFFGPLPADANAGIGKIDIHATHSDDFTYPQASCEH